MSNTFMKSPARLRITLAVAVVVIAAVAWTVGRSSNGDGAGQPAPPHMSAPSSTAPTVAPSAAPLKLARGERLVDGISVGYPHDLTGAVSAATQSWEQIGSTLDLDRARAIGRALCDDSWGDAPARLAQGVQATRVSLGAPTVGPVPVSVSSILAIEAYQVRDVSPDKMTVLLLGYRTTSASDGHIVTKLSVFPTLVVWRDGDWKVADRGEQAPDFSELRQKPGTAEALAAGWLGLTR